MEQVILNIGNEFYCTDIICRIIEIVEIIIGNYFVLITNTCMWA